MEIDPPASSDHRAGLCPNSEEWRPLWKALVESSSRELGENLPGEFRLVTIDGQILPMLIPHPGQPAADVCSAVSRYSHYPLAEIRKQVKDQEAALAAAPGGAAAVAAVRSHVFGPCNCILELNPNHCLLFVLYTRLHLLHPSRP